MRKRIKIPRRKLSILCTILSYAFHMILVAFIFPAAVYAKEPKPQDGQLLTDYRDYQERLNGIEGQWEIGRNRFRTVEEQIFPIETECFGNIYLVPAMEER